MAITAGGFTVGTGGDYATWNLAIADIAGTGLTGDLTLTQISDVADTVNINLGGSPIPLGGFVLLMTSDTDHNGDKNSGWEWDPFGGTTTIEVSGSGTLEASELKITGVNGINFNTLSVSFVLIHDILFIAAGAFTPGVIGARAGSGGLTMYNCICADTDYHIVQQVFQLTLDDPDAAIRIFNNVAAPLPSNTNNRGFLLSPAAQIFTDLDISNNVFTGDSSREGFYFGGVTPDATLLAGMFNNASTDATSLDGTVNPIESFIAATEFESLVSGDADYLIPKSDSQFKESGTSVNNPTAVDIAGKAYGANPPMGAHVAAAAAQNGNMSVILNVTRRQFRKLAMRNPKLLRRF